MISVSCLSRHKAFTPLELQIASLLAEKSSQAKTLLLQLTSVDLCMQFIRAGWLAGWRVALLNSETSASQLATIQEKLGACLLVRAHGEKQAIIQSGDVCIELNDWLEPGNQNELKQKKWDEEECALILFTSGTTGAPKGVCHSLGNILRSAELYVDHFGLSKGDTLLTLAPLHSVSGIRSLVIAFYCDRKVEFLQPANFLQLITSIEAYQSVHVLCGPVFVRQLAAYGKRVEQYLRKVKFLHCTGADLDEQDRRTVESTFSIPVLNYYGLTETTGLVLAERIGRQQPGLLPPPCEGVSLETVPNNFSEDLLQLVVHSPNVFLGYLGEELFRKVSFFTEDLVQSNTEGTYLLHGRSSGLVKAPSTEWIHPRRMEKWLSNQLNSKKVDCVIEPIKVAGGYALKVAIDNISGFSIPELEDRIVGELGIDYLPCSWEHVRIVRSALGKVIHIESINILK